MEVAVKEAERLIYVPLQKMLTYFYAKRRF
jgi:hypothetical protein